MLSGIREISLDGTVVLKTPALVPSFSSKAFERDEVKDILGFAKQLITEQILVSAYDIHYHRVPTKLTFPSLVFLDSGGYEASQDQDLSDTRPLSRAPQEWNMKLHAATVARWNFGAPTVLVSYDHPKLRRPIKDQIERAKRLFNRYPQAACELLFKPESRKARDANIDEIVRHRHELSAFSAIGFTEKELGPSVLKRMIAIARVRRALQEIHLELPIHVFGSLDTVSTPLYFLAGADIFDGLTWLRYAFREGSTIYKYHYGALSTGIYVDDYKLNAQCWNNNYYYMLNMQAEMSRFVTTGDFAAFKWHGGFLKESFDNLLASVGGA